MITNEQDVLPGGRIGAAVNAPDAPRLWLRDANPRHEPDQDLERTAVRQGPDGWYVVTSALEARTATRRQGPYRSLDEALEGAVAMTGHNPGDPPQLPPRIRKRIREVSRESRTHELYERTVRWTLRIGARKEQQALDGKFCPGTAQFQPLFAGESDPESDARLLDLVLAAASGLAYWTADDDAQTSTGSDR